MYQDYDVMVTRFYDDIRANNRIAVVELQEPVNNIVDSIIRNPDACMLLTKLRRKGDYIYNHAIGCSVWAAAMGRQLGLPKKVLVSMSLGALLIDVGKLQVPDAILNKSGQLSFREREIAKGHIDFGLAMLQKTKGVDSIAFQMVLTHHERHNGKGYPKGLAGKSIPVYGRIAGIVDTYDALVSDKPYRPGLAPSEAIRTLYNVREVDFQPELVEEFIQALGVYPAGSLVELSNGQVGIVVAEHRSRRLRPRLLLLLDRAKKALETKTYLDLHRISHDDNGKPLEILRSLTPGEYGLRPEDIVI
jgi:HD-GYP domain-containing protein (c-di-GMP phosphodiesterase class II)